MATKEVKVIDSGISAKHADAWTVNEAIREVLQNWLDVKAEFGGTGSVTWDNGVARIKDAGPGMKMSHLAFGESDKMNGSIGQFGEGLKSAFVTLVRENRTVEIQTNGMVIHPTFQESENFGVETLHYEISPMVPRLAARLKGTAVRLECDETELENGKAYFVEFKQRRSKNAPKTDNDFQWVDKAKTISLPGGFVYVKNSRIGTIQGAQYSYHLSGTSAEDATNRDRDAVNMDVVEPMIVRIIHNTSSTKVMETILNSMIHNQNTWEGDRYLDGYQVKSSRIWMRVYNRVRSDQFVLPYDAKIDRQAEYRGYHIMENLSRRVVVFLREIGVKSSRDVVGVKSSKPKLGVRTLKSLPADSVRNFKWARKMVKKYYNDPGKILIVDNIKAAVGGATDKEWGGCYDSNKDRILISSGMLMYQTRTLHVLLHETVHKVTRTSDCTSQFESALLDVAVNMIAKRHRRELTAREQNEIRKDSGL